VITVLLTDGAFTGLIRTLREAYPGDVRIVGLSMDIDTPHQAIIDAFYIISSHEDPEYINELIQIINKEHVNIIFPIVSEGLENLMQNESLILSKTGARILSSPLSALQIANDKGLLYSFLQSNSDPVLSNLAPVFCLAETKASLKDAIQSIHHSGKKACIKRRRGEDAAGFWIIDDQADYTAQLFYQQPNRRLSSRVLDDMLLNIGDDDSIPPYMACEFLPGEEWDCDVLCMDGEMISVTTRINISMSGGLTSVLEVRDNPYLASCCECIVSALNLSYIACISFRADSSGRFFLLEINPRVMGNIYVSALAGNNYVKMAIDLLYGKTVHSIPPRCGIRTSLYYDQLVIRPKTGFHPNNQN